METTLLKDKLLLAVGVKGAKYVDVIADDLISTIIYLHQNVDKNLISVDGDYFSLTDYAFPSFMNVLINLGFITLTSSTKTNLVLCDTTEVGTVLSPVKVKAIFSDLKSLGSDISTEQFNRSNLTVSDLSILPVLVEDQRRAFVSGGKTESDLIYISGVSLNLNSIMDETVPIKVLVR